MLLQLRRLVADLLSQTTECRCQCRRISSQLFQTGAFSARVGAGAQGWTPVARWQDKGCGLSFQSLNLNPSATDSACRQGPQRIAALRLELKLVARYIAATLARIWQGTSRRTWPAEPGCPRIEHFPRARRLRPCSAGVFVLVKTCRDHAGPGYMPWLRSLRPKKVTLLH